MDQGPAVSHLGIPAEVEHLVPALFVEGKLVGDAFHYFAVEFKLAGAQMDVPDIEVVP